MEYIIRGRNNRRVQPGDELEVIWRESTFSGIDDNMWLVSDGKGFEALPGGELFDYLELNCRKGEKYHLLVTDIKKENRYSVLFVKQICN